MIVSGSYLEAGLQRESLRCLWRGVLAYPLNVTRVMGLPLRRLGRLIKGRRRATS
jgi:hypothetical protein